MQQSKKVTQIFNLRKKENADIPIAYQDRSIMIEWNVIHRSNVFSERLDFCAICNKSYFDENMEGLIFAGASVWSLMTVSCPLFITQATSVYVVLLYKPTYLEKVFQTEAFQMLDLA